MKMFDRAAAAVQQAVEDSVFPSAAFAVGTKDEIIREECFGVCNLTEKPPVPVNTDTLYDLASLSKVVSTSMIALRMIENGELRLDDNMNHFFPGTLYDKREITIRQIMTHSSGIPAHFFLSEETSDPGRAAEAVLLHPLCCKPGTEVHYSCMGYILLGRILEKIGGKPLDGLAEELVFQPLGMNHTGYCPRTGSIASTERDPANGSWLKGRVHDENARFLKGVSGNAGVFSDLHDMERFAQMLAGNGKLHGSRFLSPAAMKAALRNYTAGMEENRGLGFKLAFGDANFMGDFISPSAFGHTGFTGTSLVVDPEQGLFVLLLTNRVHPVRENNGIIRFRGCLHNMIFSEWSTRGDTP